MPRRRLARKLLFPISERSFTYDRYEVFLGRIVNCHHRVVPLREFRSAEALDDAVIGLRHDVDERLESALELAEREYRRELRATYFVLHSARYWKSPNLIDCLKMLQDGYGHEIGWHNDLVTLELVHGVDARMYLARELDKLRSAGICIVGVAAHGSPHRHRLGYTNSDFFSEFRRRDVVRIDGTERRIPRASLSEFGFEYDAFHLDNDLYFSDASFDARGTRRHPDEFDVCLGVGRKAIVLTHPCHWDAHVAAKFRRLAGRVALHALGRRPVV